jgi:hypothetical protein
MSIFTKVSEFVTGNFGWIWTVGFLLLFTAGIFLVPGFFAKAIFVVAFAGKVFEMYSWTKRTP